MEQETPQQRRDRKDALCAEKIELYLRINGKDGFKSPAERTAAVNRYKDIRGILQKMWMEENGHRVS